MSERDMPVWGIVAAAVGLVLLVVFCIGGPLGLGLANILVGTFVGCIPAGFYMFSGLALGSNENWRIVTTIFYAAHVPVLFGLMFLILATV